MADIRLYVGLTGGTTLNLDGKATSGLSDGDNAIGLDGLNFRFYKYSSTETGSENSPFIIIPDDNATGTGAWVLMSKRVFYPDPAQADQGAAVGSLVTVKDIVDAVGTSSKTTIVFRRGTSGNTTDYVFGTSETIPSNFKLKFEEGARLSPSSGKTVTPYSPENIICGDTQQIFTGSGTVDFTTGGHIPMPWYNDLQKALTATGSGFVCSIYENVSLATAVTIPTGVHLNLNGHKISASAALSYVIGIVGSGYELTNGTVVSSVQVYGGTIDASGCTDGIYLDICRDIQLRDLVIRDAEQYMISGGGTVDTVNNPTGIDRLSSITIEEVRTFTDVATTALIFFGTASSVYVDHCKLGGSSLALRDIILQDTALARVRDSFTGNVVDGVLISTTANAATASRSHAINNAILNHHWEGVTTAGSFVTLSATGNNILGTIINGNNMNQTDVKPVTVSGAADVKATFFEDNNISSNSSYKLTIGSNSTDFWIGKNRWANGVQVADSSGTVRYTDRAKQTTMLLAPNVAAAETNAAKVYIAGIHPGADDGTFVGNRVPVAFAGQLIGFSVFSAFDIDAGTLTFTARVNGSPVAGTLELDSTFAANDVETKEYTRGTAYVLAQGDYIHLTYTTSADFSTTVANPDFIITLIMEY
jgi:hypothetical protein